MREGRLLLFRDQREICYNSHLQQIKISDLCQNSSQINSSKSEPNSLKFIPNFFVRFVQECSSIFVHVAILFDWEYVVEKNPRFLCQWYNTTTLECVPNPQKICCTLDFCAHKQQYYLSFFNYLTLPLIEESVSHHSQLIYEGYKFASSQSLSEDVCYVLINGYKL
jgi:hypothetical protein